MLSVETCAHCPACGTITPHRLKRPFATLLAALTGSAPTPRCERCRQKALAVRRARRAERRAERGRDGPTLDDRCTIDLM